MKNIEENKMNVWKTVRLNQKEIQAHFAVWFVYYLFNLVWYSQGKNFIAFLDVLLSLCLWALTFYIFQLFIFPKFLYQRKWYFVILMIIVLFPLYVFCAWSEESFIAFLKNESLGVPLKNIIKFGSAWYFNFIIIALGYHFYGESLKEREQKLQTQTELQKTQIELKNSQLDSLKAQFNPHFLFNTLWYVYALVQDTGSKDATKAVELLSLMMRYSMKDYAVGSLAPLGDELNYVNNYVELQQLRTPMMKLDYQVEGDTKGIKILPLVLMSFVENAFKHGKLDEPENPLIIHLTAVQGDYIRFFRSEERRVGKEC